MAAGTLFLNHNTAFGENDVQAMALAMEDVCRSLGISKDHKAAEVVATRIIELAKRGERHPAKLRERVLAEANGATWFMPESRAPAPQIDQSR